jgi:hypothetical protein
MQLHHRLENGFHAHRVLHVIMAENVDEEEVSDKNN